MKPLSQAPTIILSLLSLTTLSTSISTSTPHQPLFLLTNISFSASYIYSTPAHLAASSGHISFSLNNTAIDTYSPSPYQYGSGSGPQTTSCAATCDDYPGVYCAGWEVWKCDSGNANTDANTTFSFEDAGLFNVTQIWAKSGKKLKGVGSGKADLKCTENVWTNPDWVLGQLYRTSSTTCQPAELGIVPVVSRG